MPEPRLVIWVEFQLQPGTRDCFLELVKRNAASSMQNEPGCRRFDVMVPQEGENTVNLYEIYDNEAVFQAHLQTPHFAEFKDTVSELVLDQKISRLNVWETPDFFL